jgi:EAL domain-containing protein (putative c-di-GMP-specific phosphodiesterase class I)
VAVEALARWPDRDGLVPAARFIPVAEDMGLIDAIGEWVMEEVCAQLGCWTDEGLDIAVAFNLSLREMWNPVWSSTWAGSSGRPLWTQRGSSSRSPSPQR